MSFIDGDSRDQISLLPACVDDYVATDALVRVADAFVASLDLSELGFNRGDRFGDWQARLSAWRHA